MTVSSIISPTVSGVIRGSGYAGAISSPTQIANLALWFDASDATTLYTDAGVTNVNADGDDVYRWVNKANSLYVESIASSDRPKYKTGIQNGLSVVRADGTEHLFNTTQSGLTSDSQLTVFAVSAIKSTSHLGAIWCNSASNNDRVVVFGDTRASPNRIGLANPAATPGPSDEAYVNYSPAVITTDTFRSISMRRDGTDLRGYYNAALQDSNTVGDAGDTDNNAIRLFSQHSGSTKLNGDIAEVIVYERALSDSEMTRVWDYLNTKWAIY